MMVKPPLSSSQGRQPRTEDYFFFPPACLAAEACSFWWVALLVLDCFCEDFF